MQYVNITKTIDLESEIKELLLISIDEKIDTIDDKDGVRLSGKIAVGGKAKLEDIKEFSENIEIDIFLTYDEINERNSLNISINDFNYKIDKNKLILDVSLKIDGLKEIEATFLAQENNELLSEGIKDSTLEIIIDEEEAEREKITNEEIIEEKQEIEEIVTVETIEENVNENEIEKKGREKTYNETKETSNQIEAFEDKKLNIEEKAEKKSLLKSVFSNKRIKEEVSWKLHCVKDETTYKQIAVKYNVDENKLISLNKNEKLIEGKLIFLPIE